MSAALQRAALIAGFLVVASQAFAQTQMAPIETQPAMPAMPMPAVPGADGGLNMPAQAPAAAMPEMPMPAMPSATAQTMPKMPMPQEDDAKPEMPEMPLPSVPQSTTSDESLKSQYQKIVELYEAGTYDEAVPLANDFLDAIKSRFGDDNSTYAAAISVLARLYQAQGRFEDAETYVKRALAIDERDLPSEHPNVVGDLGALGQLYQNEGHLDEAEPLLRRALSITEKSSGSDPASVGRALNNLAWLYQEQGRYIEAEPLVTRSLSLIEKALGAKHDDYGRALDTLAKVYEGEGRVNEAEPLYRQALAVLENKLGPQHDSVAASRENLGGLIKSLGRLDEAEPLLKRALEIKEGVYGPKHPKVASSLSQLGDLYRLQGKADEAEALFQRALEIRKATIREIPVYFATDRQPDKHAKTVTFGGEEADTLAFGQAKVVVDKPDPVRGRSLPHSPLPESSGAADTPNFETTEVARLAIHNIAVVDDKYMLVTEAQKRLDAATVFPKQAFVFVHGFNVPFESALRRTAQIAYDLDFDGAPFLFSWPSRGGLWNYFSDRENADAAADHLKEFLEKVVAETHAAKIHLIAHSMGNVVLLDALEKIKLSSGPQSRLRFAEIILHSPDVGKKRFSQLMRAINGLGTRATLYESASDRALGFSAWIWGVRAGAVPSVVPGVETIDTTAAGSSYLGWNHDLYATNPTIFNDMRLVLELGEHPPDKRSSAFRATATQDGTYWQYRRPTEIKATPIVAGSIPGATGQDTFTDDNQPAARPTTTESDLKRAADQVTKLQADLKAARDEAAAANRSSEEMRQQLEQERAAKDAAAQASQALRAAVEAAERTAHDAQQQLEQERSAREKAERDASAAQEQRTLDAAPPGQDKKNEAATTDGAKVEKPEKTQTETEKSTAVDAQPPVSDPATQRPATEGAASSPPKADEKRSSEYKAKTSAARKRRVARDGVQNYWPF